MISAFLTTYYVYIAMHSFICDKSFLFSRTHEHTCTGYLGSSIARMEEANRREKLSSKISVVDNELSKIISHITTRFNDNITYKVMFPAHSISTPAIQKAQVLSYL